MRKKRIINIVFGVYILLAVVFLVFMIKGWSIKDLMSGKMSAEKIINFESNEEYSINQVAIYMHKLANGLIIAEDNEIWGTEDMNKKNLATALKMAKSLPESDQREDWISIIKTWQKANFSHIVDDHNTVWRFLDGGLGKAIKVNTVKVEEAEKSLK